MVKIDKLKYESEWDSWIEQEIVKYSNKPFKNGKLTNIVKNITINPHSGKKAFEVSDGSIVDCYQCILKELK